MMIRGRRQGEKKKERKTKKRKKKLMRRTIRDSWKQLLLRGLGKRIWEIIGENEEDY